MMLTEAGASKRMNCVSYVAVTMKGGTQTLDLRLASVGKKLPIFVASVEYSVHQTLKWSPHCYICIEPLSLSFSSQLRLQTCSKEDVGTVHERMNVM